MKKDWQTLRVRQWESTRYWVQSQTRKGVEHLVDIDPIGCSCEHSNDYRRDGERKTWCAHILRVRQWLRDGAQESRAATSASMACPGDRAPSATRPAR